MSTQHQQFNDGSRCEITADGAWDLTLPSGKHIRAQASNAETALLAVEAERQKFILAAWGKGTLGPKGQFVCSLT